MAWMHLRVTKMELRSFAGREEGTCCWMDGWFIDVWMDDGLFIDGWMG